MVLDRRLKQKMPIFRVNLVLQVNNNDCSSMTINLVLQPFHNVVHFYFSKVKDVTIFNQVLE